MKSGVENIFHQLHIFVWFLGNWCSGRHGNLCDNTGMPSPGSAVQTDRLDEWEICGCYAQVISDVKFSSMLKCEECQQWSNQVYGHLLWNSFWRFLPSWYWIRHLESIFFLLQVNIYEFCVCFNLLSPLGFLLQMKLLRGTWGAFQHHHSVLITH